MQARALALGTVFALSPATSSAGTDELLPCARHICLGDEASSLKGIPWASASAAIGTKVEQTAGWPSGDDLQGSLRQHCAFSAEGGFRPPCARRTARNPGGLPPSRSDRTIRIRGRQSDTCHPATAARRRRTAGLARSGHLTRAPLRRRVAFTRKRSARCSTRATAVTICTGADLSLAGRVTCTRGLANPPCF